MFLALALAACLHQESPKASGDEPVRASSASKSKTSGYDRRYCGIYCAAAGCQALGHPVQLSQFIKPEFIQTQGSSAADIAESCRQVGVETTLLHNCGEATLRTAQSPVVLHVRRSGYGATFQHWVLFLGMDDGAARILDPPDPSERWTVDEVLAQWDGVAVVLTMPGEPPQSVVWAERGRNVFIILGASAIWLTAVQVLSRFGRLRFALAAPILTVFSALVWHGAIDDSLRMKPSVGEVRANARYYPAPALDFDEFERRRHGAGSPFLVDSRDETSFGYGSVPNAVNVPIMESVRRRRAAFEDVAFNREIILYCESEGCSYADAMASWLQAVGYTQVSIYRGGHREWEGKMKAKGTGK